MKRSLELYNAKNYYAGFKAVEDVTLIAHSLGYIPFKLYGLRHPKNFIRYWYTFLHLMRILIYVKSSDICLLQWPLYTPSDRFIFWGLKLKCRHLQLLVHDLSSVRNNENQILEMSYIRMAELVIVHTKPMKKYLSNNGIDSSKIKVLNTFDYLVEDDCPPRRKLTKEVVFAGNLSKSSFLKHLMNSPIRLSLLCYGEIDFVCKSPIVYKGLFEAGRVESIVGSWGLVWDGDSVDTCNGLLGNYLRMNSPHKVSMYIVARLPIIIWREAALANYILDNGLGLTIGGLAEISDLLLGVSESDYHQLLLNIDDERIKLIQGKHLIDCLS